VRLLLAGNKLTGLISFHASHLGVPSGGGKVERIIVIFYAGECTCEGRAGGADENINSFAYVLVGRSLSLSLSILIFLSSLIFSSSPPLLALLIFRWYSSRTLSLVTTSIRSSL
jgi:hypothetical protein